MGASSSPRKAGLLPRSAKPSLEWKDGGRKKQHTHTAAGHTGVTVIFENPIHLNHHLYKFLENYLICYSVFFLAIKHVGQFGITRT